MRRTVCCSKKKDQFGGPFIHDLRKRQRISRWRPRNSQQSEDTIKKRRLSLENQPATDRQKKDWGNVRKKEKGKLQGTEKALKAWEL